VTEPSRPHRRPPSSEPAAEGEAEAARGEVAKIVEALRRGGYVVSLEGDRLTARLPREAYPKDLVPPTVEQTTALELQLASMARNKLDADRAAAGAVRDMARIAVVIRESLQQDGPTLDEPTAVQRFHAACRDLVAAVDAARSAIPAVVGQARGTVCVDHAPSTARVLGKLAEALVRSGRRVTAKSLASLGVKPSKRADRDPDDPNDPDADRKAYDQAIQRARVRVGTRKVTGTKRRGK